MSLLGRWSASIKELRTMSRPVLLVFLLLILIITSQFEWKQQVVPDLDTTPSISKKQNQNSNREVAVKEKGFRQVGGFQIDIKRRDTKMSRRGSSGPRLELWLNLSPPRANSSSSVDSPTASETSSDMSIDHSSCVSSEPDDQTMHYLSMPEAKAMVLAGCPRCLMYVMLSEVDPKCPKCKSSVLLDFFSEGSSKRR
ncbi:protein GL2-INTERACTING REPRESSOR 1-like [Malus sylvestris]|uniref:protein GL2-INTERACTING REPRESSOR 1-like n=1 Tax=Malus sylvestris TaxID=3752 RepID=UPI0021ABFED5|nr:protein GL2-INTERACTING REPRESSOR 1-like [Malus sylvestris]